MRYFTDGLASGGRAFVNGVFETNRRFFGPKRRDGERKLSFAERGGLCMASARRAGPVRAPLVT